jgi:predicted transcriptional regulator
MRTTVTLDDDVARAAQELARTTGRRLGAVLSELARRGLKAGAASAAKGGFPTFAVARDAPIIPADRARTLLEDDTL